MHILMMGRNPNMMMPAPWMRVGDKKLNTPSRQSSWTWHSVNNRTVVQLLLMASHPPLSCHVFIECTNLLYAFWVTMHL